MTPETRQELTWIREAQQDPAAFEPIFNKYYNAIFNYILRRAPDVSTAKDITSNTFLKALDHIGQFKWKGIPFSSWLYRIATNEINQHYRKNKKLVHLSETQAASIESDVQSDAGLTASEEALEKDRQAIRIKTVLIKLKPKYQDVLTLRYFEDLPVKEIAIILDLPENTVKTHIRRGLKNLEKWL